MNSFLVDSLSHVVLQRRPQLCCFIFHVREPDQVLLPCCLEIYLHLIMNLDMPLLFPCR